MQLPDIKNAREINSGGEGRILEHPSDKTKVIKLYHAPRPKTMEPHLLQLMKLSKAFVRPIDVYSNGKQVVGYSMDYVNLSDYWLFNNLFNKAFCNNNSIDMTFKVKVLTTLKSELEALHKLDIVIGDLNQYNIFVSKKAEILFVDVDSYGTKAHPHSGILLDEIRDWTTTDISPQTDAWAYDILTFWATTHCHPFKWVVPGNTDTLEQRVRAGKSILSKITGVRIPPLYIPPVGDVLKQFLEIFKGRRYMVELTKTVAPVTVQIPAAVPTSSDIRIREICTHVTHVYASNSQFTVKSDGKWKLYSANQKAVIGEQIVNLSPKITYLYPGIMYGLCTEVCDNMISTGQKGTCQSFRDPFFYFNNGSVLVIDFSMDILWCYDINWQLGNTLRCTSTPIFAKSVTFRGMPIQNFGKAKAALIPVKDRYILQSLPEDVKDGYFCRGFSAIEIKGKKSTEYWIMYHSQILRLDYLPFFAVNDNDMLFIPNDGFIEVLSSTGQTLTKLNINICTRSSQLYWTQAGILLLENNILYILNK